VDVRRQGQDNADVAQVLIETLTNLGRIDEAKKLVNDALAKSRTPVMLNQAGYVALRSNDPAGAIAMFEETLKASPKDVPALYFRALARRMTPGITVDQVLPDLQAAKAAMEESRKQGRSLASMEADVRLQIGSLLRQAGRSEDAIAELDAGTRVAPDDKRLVIELSRTFAQQTPPRWAKVDETLSLARQRPALVNDIDVIFEQADMSARRRDTARAVAASREAVALAPTNVQVLGKHQQILLSVDANREFIADSDRFPKEVLDQWNVRAGRALALLRTNNKTAADTELTTALKKADELTNPKDIRAARYLIAQSLSGAITSTGLAERFATDLQSDNAFRLLAVTQFLSESKPDQASGMADRVISDPAADPLEKAQAHALLGAYALTGPKVDLTVAATRYRQAIALNNLNIEYLNNLAYVLSLSENVEQRREGLTFAQQAFDLSAKASGTNAADPLIADTYGWLLILNDQVDEGMKVLNEALLRREIPEIMLHLAEGHLKKNQPIEAVRNLEKCLAFVSRVGNNARIDPGLRARVEDAQRRASEMLSRKAENSGR